MAAIGRPVHVRSVHGAGWTASGSVPGWACHALSGISRARACHASASEGCHAALRDWGFSLSALRVQRGAPGCLRARRTGGRPTRFWGRPTRFWGVGRGGVRPGSGDTGVFFGIAWEPINGILVASSFLFPLFEPFPHRASFRKHAPTFGLHLLEKFSGFLEGTHFEVVSFLAHSDTPWILAYTVSLRSASRIGSS